MKNCLAVLGLCLAQDAVAAPSRTDFHRAVYALHEQQIAGRSIRTEDTTGDYHGAAAKGYRYRITDYFDAATGRLLSRIERNADRPEAIHISTVYVHDDNGRVVRHYFSSAAPWKPDYASHAYINLHHYNGMLHSWRQFELDGRVNYEFCDGELGGKRVRISLDWTDINEHATATPEYRACFGGMGNDWDTYLTPR